MILKLMYTFTTFWCTLCCFA